MERKYATISQFFFYFIFFYIFIHVIVVIVFKTKRLSNVVCDLYSSGKCKPTIHFVILDKPFTIHWNDSACNCTMTSLNYLSPEQKKRKQNRYFTFEEHFSPIHFSIIWIAVILSPLSHRSNIKLCKKCLQCAHFYVIASNCFQFFLHSLR